MHILIKNSRIIKKFHDGKGFFHVNINKNRKTSVDPQRVTTIGVISTTPKDWNSCLFVEGVTALVLSV